MRCRINHPRLRRLFILVIGVLLQVCGCERAPDTDNSSSKPAERAHSEVTAGPVPEKVEAVDLVDGPITTFEQACSRCHGPQGSFHGEGFAGLSDDKLRETVEKMMKGPGQLQPAPVQIEAMAAYQRALRDHRPFICVTNGAAFLSGKDTALQGEVAPGASVELDKAGVKTAATVNGAVWTLAQPPRPPFVLIASNGPFQVQFDFPAAIWSK